MGTRRSADSVLESAQKLLQGVSGRALDRAETEAAALELAGHLFRLAESLISGAERARRARLSRLLGDPKGQLLSVLLTDRVARDKGFAHAADQLSYLVSRLGVPKFLGTLERLQLGLGARVGTLVPELTGRLIAKHIRQEVAGLVLPHEPKALARFLEERRAQGVAVNVNQLGEEVLGETQAAQRLREYIELLSRPGVETISVKLSSIFSQVDLFAWDSSHDRLAERLRQIYRVALSSASAPPDLAPDSSARPAATRSKLVYLDMEAYRDLRFTVSLFQRVLDEPEFQQLTAGLVLQAYIPESAELQRELTTWASERRQRGGAPLRLRIVKGANLAAERVQCARLNWTLPIYSSKAEVDANYKRMLFAGTDPAHADSLQLGIASHNIFDLALGLVLRASRGVGRSVGFEVLEGMAGAVQRALGLLGAPVLVYAPVVSEHELDTAVAYLIRRLDENTASENFLRHAFSMQPGDAEYAEQAKRFREAFRAAETVSVASRRAADRFNPVRDLGREQAFSNEPDTDFSVATHRNLVTRALDALRSRPPFELCSVIGGARRATGDVVAGFDPSRPGAEPYRYHMARAAEVQAAIAVGQSALDAPLRPSLSERIELVRGVARALRRARPELIAVMLLDAGKRVSEADAEVSEAIDFAEYYLRQAEMVERDGRLAVRPRGITLVTSPWNFPLAIPLSGVLAALLAGNSVIFKPACETALSGERLAALLWEAGVPTDSLGLLLCRDELGTTLLRHPAVRAVVLTGATSTARYFLDQRPSMHLCAETGGKNPLIISAFADRELAIRDLVASAFGYAGQKCSAASLAILDAEVYDDRHFQSQLRDAAASLQVGSAWDPASLVTPLIRPPEEALRRGLTQLEPGESWLLEPREQPGNPRLWSPGIKLGVTAGSFTHQTELFGPVLGVLRARDFEHALELANATPYGLVAGLHSLDEREQARFIARTAAGNLYVNRPITGAIVGRQPFGGHKASSVGPGAKAGGPNYVVQLQDWADALPPTVASAAPLSARPELTALASWAERELPPRELGRWLAYVSDYAQSVSEYFREDYAAAEVLGQENVLRYLPCAELLLWAVRETSVFDLACACAAAVLSGNRFQLSLTGSDGADGLSRQLFELAALCRCPAQIESAEQLVARLGAVERVRWLGRSPAEPAEVVLRAAAGQGCYVSTRPVIGQGRYELLFNHREQAISLDYHRYGHLGWRSAGLDQSPALRGDDVR